MALLVTIKNKVNTELFYGRLKSPAPCGIRSGPHVSVLALLLFLAFSAFIHALGPTRALAVDGINPTITDNQDGDEFFRSSNNGTYNVDFSDTGGSFLDYFQVRACSTNSNCGDVAAWTDTVTGIGADSYTFDWSIPASVWSSLDDGVNYISVRVYDGASNSAEQGPVFYIVKNQTTSQDGWDPAKFSWTSTDVSIDFTTNNTTNCRWDTNSNGYADMPPANECSGADSTSHTCDVTGLVAGPPSNYYDSVYIDCIGSGGSAENVVYHIDDTAPSDIPELNDGTTTSGTDLDVTTTDDKFYANWTDATDDQSGISNYWYSIGTTSGASDTVSWTSVSGSANDLTHPGLSLESGTTYYITMLAQNNVGEFSGQITSDGVYVDGDAPFKDNWSPATGTVLSSSTMTITFDTYLDSGLTTPENATCRWGLVDYRYGSMSSDNECDGATTSSQSCDITGMQDGSEIVYISCLDGLGNQDEAATNAELEYTIPLKGFDIATTTPAISFTTNETAWCRWSLSDLGYTDIGGNDCSGGGTSSMTCYTSGLSQGSEYVYVSCKDSLENKDTDATNENINYNVDTVAPVQSGWDPASGTVIATTTPSISLETDENAWCRWSLADQGYTAIGGNDCSGGGTESHDCAVSGLAEGSNQVFIACRDSNNNENPAGGNADLDYTVDLTAPVQSGWSPVDGATVTTTSQFVSLSTDEDSYCRWSLTDQDFSDITGNACTGWGGTSHSCGTSELQEGSEYVYISCSDIYGNEQTSGTNKDLNYMVDTMTPVQSGWNPAKGATITTTMPALSFNTDEPASCKWSLFDQGYTAIGGNSCGATSTVHSCSALVFRHRPVPGDRLRIHVLP